MCTCVVSYLKSFEIRKQQGQSVHHPTTKISTKMQHIIMDATSHMELNIRILAAQFYFCIRDELIEGT